MKIAFTDFWQYPKAFDPNNNFLTHLIKSSFFGAEVTTPDKADVIIYTIFGNEHKKYDCKKIFFSGENKRPNYNECDYSITFDVDDYDGRNIRIPLWLYYIDWFGVETYDNPEYLLPLNYIYGENEFNTKVKTKFCSAVYSNPIGLRNEFVNKLNIYNKVDCFGKVSGFNFLPDGEKFKMDLISDYKFNVCFENSIYPGYYTEKLLHAKVAGCVPIYYSDSDMDMDFNPKCCINLNDFESIDHLIEYIIEVDSDEELYKSILNEPLFNNNIDFMEIQNKIKKIFYNRLKYTNLTLDT